MNEGYVGTARPAPVYVSSGGQAGYCGRPRSPYPIELLQLMGLSVRHRQFAPPPPVAAPRRHKPRRNKSPPAFGYESDDSSLSSDTSTYAHSNDAGAKRLSETPPPSTSGKSWSSGTPENARRWQPRPWIQHRPPPPHYPTHRIAPDRYLLHSHLFEVKEAPPDLLNGSEWDMLSQEIWDKFIGAQQTEETFRKKMYLWRFLYISIKAMFPRYGLFLVGSTISGLGTDSSDMDLCLQVRGIDFIDNRAHALVHLGFILNYIRSFETVGHADLIQAKVPILKFRDTHYNIEVDLNCNNLVGIRNTQLLFSYSQMDYRVRPLVVVVKLWAQANNINDAKNRTISSYSLALMVIHYLQCGASPAVLPCLHAMSPVWLAAHTRALDPRHRPPHFVSSNTQTLAQHMLGFLNYYATFEYDQYAVSVRTGQKVPVKECRMARSRKNDPYQWKLLCVEEPFDLSNTARSVYDPEVFEHIIEVFRCAHKRLESGGTLQDIMEASEPLKLS